MRPEPLPANAPKALRLSGFLDTPTWEDLLTYFDRNRHRFGRSGVIGGDQTWRHSTILFDFEPHASEIRRRVRSLAPSLIAWFGMPEFPIGDIEAQMVVHGDGHYFKTHKDNATPEVALRRISYTLYLFRTPKPFRGGELDVDGTVIEPENRAIVFWRSETDHEVRMTRVPSGRFEDARFSISGWIRTTAAFHAKQGGTP